MKALLYAFLDLSPWTAIGLIVALVALLAITFIVGICIGIRSGRRGAQSEHLSFYRKRRELASIRL